MSGKQRSAAVSLSVTEVVALLPPVVAEASLAHFGATQRVLCVPRFAELSVRGASWDTRWAQHSLAICGCV